ncbi:MAG: hypothetical protein WCF17_20835 [Terracidiphilus sp.]
MGIFLGAFCGPRPRIFRSIVCSLFGKAENGLNRATSSAVSSLTSPFSSINGLRFAITLCLPLVGSAKTDDAKSVRQGNITEQMQAPIQISNRDTPHLALAGVVHEDCGLEIEIRSPLKGKSTFPDVALIFGGIVRDSH